MLHGIIVSTLMLLGSLLFLYGLHHFVYSVSESICFTDNIWYFGSPYFTFDLLIGVLEVCLANKAQIRLAGLARIYN